MVRTNLSSANNIIETVAREEVQMSDIICLFRGGGQGLEIFNDVVLGEFLLRSKPALISAIGHEKDVTLVEQIADRKCITPSALGTYLNDIYEKTVKEKENSEAYLTKMISEKFQLQHKQTEMAYETTIKQLKAKERRNLILIVTALVVGLIIGVLISK
jgi:exonuclease VII large subunit